MESVSKFPGRQSAGPLQPRQNRTNIDPRPISDKSFQLSSQKQILQYFNSKNPECRLPPKSLQTPSSKDFLTIVTFLFRKIDLNFQFSGKKLIEEIPALFAGIGYPVAISKNSLLAIGAPNSWPNLLAALVWLTELVKATSQDQEQDFFPTPMTQNELLTQYTQKAYRLFMNGQDYSEELQDLSFQLQRRVKQTCKQTQILKIDIADLKVEWKNLKSKKINSGVVDRNIDSLKHQNQRIKNLDGLNQKIQNLKQIKIQKNRQYLQNKAIFQSKSYQLAQLKSIVNLQVYSVGDIEKVGKENQECISQLALLGQQKEQINNMLWELKYQTEQRVRQIQKMISDYEFVATELQMIPQTACFSYGKELRVQFFPQNLDFDKEEKNAFRPLCFLENLQLVFDLFQKDFQQKLEQEKQEHNEYFQQYQLKCQIKQDLQQQGQETSQKFRSLQDNSLQELKIGVENKIKSLNSLESQNQSLNEKVQMMIVELNRLADQKETGKKKFDMIHYFFNQEQAGIKRNIFQLTELVRIHKEKIFLFLKEAVDFTRDQFYNLQNPEQQLNLKNFQLEQ